MQQRISLFVLLAALLGALFLPGMVSAQAQGSLGGNTIASTYNVLGEGLSYGDIVSYDKGTNSYILSQVVGDENLFGVIIEQPVLLYHKTDGSVPIVQTGEALVNVSDINGPIAPGDSVTSSIIPGKGERGTGKDAQYIIGIALEPFSPSNASATSTAADGSVVSIGQIKVFVSIGTYGAAKEQSSTGPVGTFSVATILNIIQYVIAAFIAVGSVYIAFRNFMPNIREGISSVGRNPRAKASIQSMVILNAVLIVLVSVSGFALSIAIILLPI